MLTKHTHGTEGLLTHVGRADCFITLPHPARECGIVTAWWHSKVEGGDTVTQRQHDDEQRQRPPEGG